MSFRLDDAAFTFYRPCSCGGPHGLAVYVDTNDGMVQFFDSHYRLSDNLDLRGLWQRVKAAWWMLSGQHCGSADMVLTNEDVREFAESMAQAADKHDEWRGAKR